MLAALDSCDRTYILSAAHGVLDPQTMIAPYDVTLKTMSQAARVAWGERAGAQLEQVVRKRDSVRLFCGEEYIDPLRQSFEKIGAAAEAPLAPLSLGQRLQRLGQMNEESEQRHQAMRFSRMLHRLWLAQSGGRKIRDTHGRQGWPSRGLYFVLEPSHGLSGGRMPRIVRVGTHAVSKGSKTSLWDRLSTHRGPIAGGGSHRSSIFRLHVGRAMMASQKEEIWPSTWSQGQSAPREVRNAEQELETRVSELIGDLTVLWLDVGDEPGPSSERAYLERNSIGLLSRSGLLAQKGWPDWLGRHSPDWRIAASGLWNLDHIFAKPDAEFLERLNLAINHTTGRRGTAETAEPRSQGARAQLNLFQGKQDT